MTHESLDLLGPYIDVYRVDLKSLDASFYQQVAATTRIADILPVAKRARSEFHIHVEVVTNLMPSLNDSDDHLMRLAEAIVINVGIDTPWHLTTYVPYAHMTHIPPTSPQTLAHARARGLQAGLRFVYTDDITSPDAAHTICPVCGTRVIERIARSVRMLAMSDDGRCSTCGTDLALVTASPLKSVWREDAQ